MASTFRKEWPTEWDRGDLGIWVLNSLTWHHQANMVHEEWVPRNTSDTSNDNKDDADKEKMDKDKEKMDEDKDNAPFSPQGASSSTS